MTWLAVKLFLQGIPLRVWAILAAVVLLAASGLYLRAHYIGVGESRVQALWDAREAEYALQRAEAAIAARLTEERHRAEYKAIADRFLADQEKANEAHNRIVAGLRAGSIRVQKRLTCPSLPGAAADSEGAAEEGPRGLQPEDAGIAIGIGAEADEVARQLNALIQAVEATR